MMLLLSSAALIGLALQPGTAHAAGFQAKTMRDPLSTREVERGLVLGKGWLEFGLGGDYKIANGYWDADGEAVDFDHASFLYTTQRLTVRYGVARRGELFWHMPTHFVRLQNDALGTDTARWGIGDPVFGYKWEAFRSMAPATSVIAYGWYKAPAGNEAPGNYVGGPTTFTNFVLSTGTPDIDLGVQGKRQVGPASVRLGLGYTYRFSNLSQWVSETEYNQFATRIKPGNVAHGELELMVQAGPVALRGIAAALSRDVTRLGATSEGFFRVSENLEAVEGSDGIELDVIPGAVINITRGVDIDLAVNIPVMGEDLLFFPVEDLTPTRGNTYSATFEFRY